jgi:hypothetical protein
VAAFTGLLVYRFRLKAAAPNTKNCSNRNGSVCDKSYLFKNCTDKDDKK